MRIEPSRPQGSDILIVTADVALGNDIADLLASRGYRIARASTQAEATAAAQERRPDLAILDLVLPDGDGLLLCSALQAIGEMRIIIIGPGGDRRDTILGLRLGADDFVAKPVDPDEFEARVEAVLRHRPSRHDLPLLVRRGRGRPSREGRALAIEPGMDVRDRAGNNIGTVVQVYRRVPTGNYATPAPSVAVGQRVIEIRTGFLGLGKHLYVPDEAFEDVRDGCAFLAAFRDALDQVGWQPWDVKPPDLTPE